MTRKPWLTAAALAVLAATAAQAHDANRGVGAHRATQPRDAVIRAAVVDEDKLVGLSLLLQQRNEPKHAQWQDIELVQEGNDDGQAFRRRMPGPRMPRKTCVVLHGSRSKNDEAPLYKWRCDNPWTRTLQI